MFTWNADKLRFMMDAAAYTRCYDSIAGRIAPRLPENCTLCDAGCGPGFLSLALAPHCKRVLAIDNSRAALDALEEMMVQRGEDKVAVRCLDVFSYGFTEPVDAVVFSFFGGVEETLSLLKRNDIAQGFLIKKDWKTRRYTGEHTMPERFTFGYARETLRRMEIPFEAEQFTLDMGQPFRTEQDAACFYGLYAPPERVESISRERLRAKLMPTGRADFPLYAPMESGLGMIVLRAEDIPDDWEKRLPHA